MQNRIRSMMTIQWLLLLLLCACSDTDVKEAGQSEVVVEALKGDGSLNNKIISSKNTKLIAFDAKSGSDQVLMEFDNLLNIKSIDSNGDHLYVGVGDNSFNVVSYSQRKWLWDLPLLEYETSTLSEPKVVYHSGKAYAVGLQGVLTAIDVAKKDIDWLYPLDPSGDVDSYYSAVSYPTVTNDKIFIGTTYVNESNYIHAINRNTGKRVWANKLPDGFRLTGTIRLSGNTLLVPAHDLYALNPDTGDVLWQFTMADLSYGAGTPAVANGKVYVQGASATIEGRLYCLNLQNGEKLWEVDAGNDHAGFHTPIVVGNVVIGFDERGSFQDHVGNASAFVIDIESRKVLWKNEEVRVERSPVLANGQLFFYGQKLHGNGTVSENTGLICMDASTGKVLWQNTLLPFQSSASPVVIATNGIFKATCY